MAVRETLELDISRAMAQVQALGAATEQAGKRFSDGLSGAGTAGLGAARGELQGVEQDLNKAGTAAAAAAGQTKQYDESMKNVEGSTTRASSSVSAAGTAFLQFGAVLTGVVVGAGLAFTNIQDAIAPVGTLLGTTTVQGKAMSGALKEIIASSPQSADEIGASAYTILSAGISGTKNVTDALRSSQKLSEAGLGSLADATGLVTSAVNSYRSENLTAQQAAELFFGTISRGKTTTADLAQGFGQIAPLAAATGVSFKELLAATATLTATGQNASVAYTGLRGVISNILKPTADAKQVMAELADAGVHLDFTAAHLKEVGLAQFMQEVGVATGGNVEQMSRLFGSVEALNTVIALTGPLSADFAANLEKSGAAGKNLNDRAAEVEDTLSNRLKTALNQVQIALSDAFTGALPAIEGVLGGVQSLATGFAGLPQPIQTGLIALTALLGVGSLAVGAGIKISGAFEQAKNSLSRFGQEGSLADRATTSLANNLGNVARAGASLGIFFTLEPVFAQLTDNMFLAGAAAGALAGALTFGAPGAIVGATLGAITSAILGLGDAAQTTTTYTDDLVASVAQLIPKLQGLSTEDVTKQFLLHATGALTLKKALDNLLSTESVLNLTRLQGSNIAEFQQFQTVKGSRILEEFQQIAKRDPGLAQQIVDGLNARGIATGVLSNALQKAVAASDQHSEASRRAKGASDDLPPSFDATGAAAAGAAEEIITMSDALDTLAGHALSAEQADLRYIESLVAIGAAAAANGTSLDKATEAGRKNESAIIDNVQAAHAHAAAVQEETGSFDAANGVLAEHTRALFDAATAAGFDADSIITLIGRLNGIPPDVVTTILTDSDPDNITQVIDEIIRRVKEAEPPAIPVDADTAPAHEKLDALDPKFQGLGEAIFTPTVDANTAPADEAFVTTEANFAGLGEAIFTPTVDADTAPAEADNVTVTDFLNRLAGTTFIPTINPDEGPAFVDEGAVRGLLNALAATIFVPTIDPNEGPAVADEGFTRGLLNSLAGTTFTPTIGADGGPAQSERDRVNAFLSSLGPYTAPINAQFNENGVGGQLDALAAARNVFYFPIVMNATGNIVPGHLIPAAQAGAIVPATPGGTLFRIGEAGSPEVILPTDNDRQAVALLRAAGLGRLLGVGGGPGTSVSGVNINIVVNTTGNRRRDVVAGREAGVAASRQFLQTVRSQGRR